MNRYLLIVFLLALSPTLSAQDTCRVGMHIHSLYDFNTLERSFRAQLWLWMLSNETDSIDAFKTFTITNAKQYNNLFSDSELHDKKRWEYGQFDATLLNDWDTRRFPFDRQTLSIQVEVDDEVSAIRLLPDMENSTVDTANIPQDWALIDFALTRTTHSYNTNFGSPSHDAANAYKYDKIEARLSMQRQNSWLTLFKLVTGLYVSFLVSLMALIVPPIYNTPKFSASVGGLWAAIGNKHIVDMHVPSNSGITLLDVLHLITFASILSVVVTAVMSLKFQVEEKHDEVKKLNKKMFRILLISYIGLNILVIGYCSIF